MSGSLTKATTRGAAYSASANIVVKLLSLVVQVVLAWMLGPEAFGAWALTVPVMTLSELIRTSGAREILVRRQHAFRVWAGPAFWLSAIMGVIASLFTAALAVPMALMYGRPELVLLVLLCVPSPLLGALQSVPEAYLLSHKRFGAHVAGLFTSGLTMLAFQLLYASLGLGAKTFPLALVTSAVVRLGMYWRLGNPGCSLRPRVRRWRYIVGDAGRLVGTRFADWFSVNAPPLVLGLYFSDAVVGVFAYAVNTSSQAIRVMAVNLSTILFAALAGSARDPSRQEAGYLKSIGVLATIGVPVCFFQAALAEPVLSNVLKIEEWPGLIPSFQVLSIAMGLRLLTHPSRSFLLAQGRFSAAFWLSVSVGMLYLLGAALAAPHGVLVLAVTQAAIHVVTSGVWFVGSLVRSPEGLRLGMSRLAPVLLAGAVGILGTGVLAEPFYGRSVGLDIAIAAAVVVAGSGVYFGVCLVLKAQALRTTASWAVDMAPGRVSGVIARFTRMLGLTS